MTNDEKSLFLAVSLAIINGTAFVDTVSVTNNNDSGPGSFRQAILDANGNSALDTISFDSNFFTELLSEAVYQGTQDLTIQGNGSTLSGGSVDVDTDRAGTAGFS